MIQSKFVVLRSLSTFLRIGLSAATKTGSSEKVLDSGGSNPIDTWFMSSSFSSPEAFRSFANLIRHLPRTRGTDRVWREVIDPEVEDLCDEFTQHFPALEGLSDGLWNLNDLSDLQEIIGPSDRGSEPHGLGFVGVRSTVSTMASKSAHLSHSTSQTHCILP